MTLTPEEQKQLRDGIVKDARSFWEQSQSASTTNEERSNFIAGPPPSSPLRRIGWETARQACRRWAAGRGPSIAPWRDLYTRDVCEQYIEDEFGPLGGATSQPPFPGGQCAINYVVKGTFLLQSTQLGACDSVRTWTVASGSALGPIGGLVQDGSSITLKRGVLPNANLRDDATNRTCLFRDGCGVTSGTTTIFGKGYVITEVTPVSGPDNCGDLPDIFDPGSGPAIPPETGPIPSPPGWEIPNIGIEVTVDPDGTINIDFGDGEPPEKIDPGQPEPTPIAPGPPPGDQGNPGAGGEAGQDDAEGEAPEGSVLVGLRLQLIDPGPSPKVYPGGVYRGAAYIYMGGDVSLDQDFAGSLLIDDQFIYAEKDNLTRWRVSTNNGFRWNVTPYYREVE